MTEREAKLEIAARKLVKYFGTLHTWEYAEAIGEDSSTLELCVTLARDALAERREGTT